MPTSTDRPSFVFDTKNFIDKGREVVLAALDDYLQQVTRHPDARGWQDADLPQLLPAIDRHLNAVAARLTDPESTETGSARFVSAHR